MWTAYDISPFISLGWVMFLDTIPVFPHMMWGFFLSFFRLSRRMPVHLPGKSSGYTKRIAGKGAFMNQS
ncbi:hypothetical protein ACXG8N_004283, partial [Klebsiella aerogenes]